MRIFLDTEFVDDGETIDLISIGMVREDGAEYYAESAQWSKAQATPWIRENVLPYLTGPVKFRSEIACDIIDFVGAKPEFWAYYAAYDWVALCQLYGPMISLPDGWPHLCLDVQQVCISLGNPKLPPLPEGSVRHNALGDAHGTRAAWNFLQTLKGHHHGTSTSQP